MSMDTDVERHRRAWVGFTKFLTWGTAIVLIILALMAYFLV
jgi:hypothetical protein